jgi:ParB family chromosome partitioning protein
MTERRDKPSFASLFNRARVEAEGTVPLPPAPPAEPAPVQPAEASPMVEPRRRDEWTYEAMQFLVDPARVCIWPGNARIYQDLSPDNCRDLIQSIATEGMQKVAAIVRPVFDDALYEYEVIAGTRRHFAVSYLRSTSMPSLRFLIQVEILDDEAAFRLADLENRARKDVSDIERARNYAAALPDHYDGHLTRMAERLALSKSWLSKMIRVSALPDQLLAAFGSPSDLHLKPAYTLAQKLDGPTGPIIMATAIQIARAQLARRADGLAPYPAAEVLRQLNEASSPAPEQSAELRGPTGRLAMSANANKNSLTLKLHAGSGVTRKAITEAVRAALDAAEAKGFSLGLSSRDDEKD